MAKYSTIFVQFHVTWLLKGGKMKLATKFLWLKMLLLLLSGTIKNLHFACEENCSSKEFKYGIKTFFISRVKLNYSFIHWQNAFVATEVFKKKKMIQTINTKWTWNNLNYQQNLWKKNCQQVAIYFVVSKLFKKVSFFLSYEVCSCK